MYEHIPYISAGKCPECGKEMVKHFFKEGSRSHVNYWDCAGVHCTEPECEYNHGTGKCIESTNHIDTAGSA